MTHRVPWVVTFDVSGDAGRRAINRLLAGYGPRVLYTVYEIGVDRVGVDDIVRRAAEHLRPGDHLLALPRCRRCRAAHRGGTAEAEAPIGWVIS
ncbi:MAG: CRISPR-associated endonuclease Cas2 [Streptosporangiaceae bacterium]